MKKGKLTDYSLNYTHQGLLEFQLGFKYTETNITNPYSGFEQGVFYSDEKDPLVLGQEYEFELNDNAEIIIKGFLSKQELLNKIDNEKPSDIKIIEELREQTIFIKTISYRIGWFYFVSILSFVLSIISLILYFLGFSTIY